MPRYPLVLWLLALAPALLACGDASSPMGATETTDDAATTATPEPPSSTTGEPPSPTTGAPGDTTSTATGEPGTTTTPGETGEPGTTAETGEPPPPPPGSFWHLEQPADSERTWLVSPTGERVFMLGVNTVMRGKQCDGIEGWITRHAPTKSARVEWARLSTGQSGEEVVDQPYCFNSVGAFSDINDFDNTGGDSYMIRPFAQGGAQAPYSVVVNVAPKGEDRALRDHKGEVLLGGVAEVRIGDPFNPAFVADIEAMVAEDIAPRKDDPNLQLWYLGNEIGVFDKGSKGEGVRDFRRWIWSDCPAGSTIDAPQCARHALAAFLRERYAGDLAALNQKWASAYPGADFATIVDEGPRPVPYVAACNQQCRVDLQVFVHDRLLREWVRVLTTRVRAVDPNHLVSSPRMALGNAGAFRFWAPASGASPDVWIEEGTNEVGTDTAEVKYSPFDVMKRDGDAGFDIVAFNVYTGDPQFEKPWFTDGVHKVQEQSGLPIIISEFGIRARIDGWSNKGGAGSFVPNNDATDDQIQRGAYYQSQLEQFYSFRGIVGANWHAWTDRYTAADAAKQINMGLFQCDDPGNGFEAGQRWGEIDDRVAAVNCAILEKIAAKTGL